MTTDPLSALKAALAMPRGTHPVHDGAPPCKWCGPLNDARESALRAALPAIREALDDYEDTRASERAYAGQVLDLRQERDAARAEVAQLKAMLVEVEVRVEPGVGGYLMTKQPVVYWIARRDAAIPPPKEPPCPPQTATD